MNKIKSINITGIRGVKDKLPLKLDKKSILIFGENGTGKSSLTDALEWFYKDKIEHLSGAEVGIKNSQGFADYFFIVKIFICVKYFNFSFFAIWKKNISHC